MAAKIADYYHRNGYFVAQAYLPAQDIKDGAVTIAVIEGRYGSVTLRNQSKLSDALANGLLGGLNSGDTIAIAPLENRLLLLSDIPGVNVKSTLAPGAAVGTSDLIVDVTPGRRVTGSVEADNAGNRYTGEYRAGGDGKHQQSDRARGCGEPARADFGLRAELWPRVLPDAVRQGDGGSRLHRAELPSWARSLSPCRPTARPRSRASTAAIR